MRSHVGGYMGIGGDGALANPPIGGSSGERTSTATIKIEVDTSDVERAKKDLDLVTRKDVQRIVAAAMRTQLPFELARLRKRGFRSS